VVPKTVRANFKCPRVLTTIRRTHPQLRRSRFARMTRCRPAGLSRLSKKYGPSVQLNEARSVGMSEVRCLNGGPCMAKKMEKLTAEIHELSDIEKLRLVHVILKDLDKPDPEIDWVWAAEARKC